MEFEEDIMSEGRTDLVKDLVQLAIAEHSDAQTNFTNLDAKAQSTTTIAGIFLAGALAFFNGDSLQQLISIGSHPAILLLGIVVLFLMIAIALCVAAMRIRDVSVREVGLSKEEVVGSSEVIGILDLPANELPGRYENYLLQQVDEWSQVSTELRGINYKKGRAVYFGQLLLGVAIFFVAILLLYTSFRVWKLPPPTKSDSTGVPAKQTKGDINGR